MGKTQPVLRESQTIPAQKKPKSETATVTEQDIALRAYSLYDARGREDGHDLDDWLQAERELLEEVSR